MKKRRHRRTAETHEAGFLHIDNTVFYDPSLRGKPLLVYLYLWSYCWRDNTCWPARTTIARALGMDSRTVNAAIKYLAQHGYVTLSDYEIRRASGTKHLTKFTMYPPKPRPTTEEKNAIFHAAMSDLSVDELSKMLNTEKVTA